MPALSALFYPFVTSHQLEVVKLACVYFDEVVVLNPISIVEDAEFQERYAKATDRLMDELGETLGLRYATAETMQHECVPATVAFYKNAKPLIDAGVIRVVNPFDQFQSMGLGEALRALVRHRSSQWSEDGLAHWPSLMPITSCERMATLEDMAYWHEQRGKRALEARGNAITSIMFDCAALLTVATGALPLTGTRCCDGQFTDQATGGIERDTRDVPRSDRSGENRVDFLKDLVNREHLKGVHETRFGQGFQVTKQTIIEEVPAFQRIPFADILHLREHCADELAAFRLQMTALATSLSQGPIDNDCLQEMRDMVHREISPALHQLQRKLALSRAKWAKRLSDKATSVKTLATLASTVFVGIPIHYGLLIAAGIIGIQAALEGYIEQREIKTSNALSFLLELRETSSR